MTTLSRPIEGYYQLVKSVANKYRVPGYTFDDLYQEGVIALLTMPENTKNIKESYFVYMAVKSRIYQLYLKSNAGNAKFLNQAYSYDAGVKGERSNDTHLDLYIGNNDYEPLALLLAVESVREYKKPPTPQRRNKRSFAFFNVEPMMDDRGCWEWSGYYQKTPIIEVKGKRVPAAKHLYEEKYGPVPAGRRLRSTCKNLTCVNPDHRLTRDG